MYFYYVGPTFISTKRMLCFLFSGLIIWKIDANGSQVPKDVDVPISIPDVDSDGHSDLVTLSRYEKGKHRLAIISGRTGKIFKQPPLDSNCDSVNNLTYDYNSGTVFYSCSTSFGCKKTF